MERARPAMPRRPAQTDRPGIDGMAASRAVSPVLKEGIGMLIRVALLTWCLAAVVVFGFAFHEATRQEDRSIQECSVCGAFVAVLLFRSVALAE